MRAKLTHGFSVNRYRLAWAPKRLVTSLLLPVILFITLGSSSSVQAQTPTENSPIIIMHGDPVLSEYIELMDASSFRSANQGILVFPEGSTITNDVVDENSTDGIRTITITVDAPTQARYRNEISDIFLGVEETVNVEEQTFRRNDNDGESGCDESVCRLIYVAINSQDELDSALVSSVTGLLRSIHYAPIDQDPPSSVTLTIMLEPDAANGRNNTIATAVYTINIRKDDDPTQVRFFNAAGEELHNDDIDPNPLEVFEGGLLVRFTVELDAVELGEDISARTPLEEDNSFRLDSNRSIVTNPIPNPYSTMTESFFPRSLSMYGNERLGRIFSPSQNGFLSDNGVVRRVEFRFVPHVNNYGRVEIRGFEIQGSNRTTITSSGGGFDIVVNPTNDLPFFSFFIHLRTIQGIHFGSGFGFNSSIINSANIRVFKDPGLLSSADNPETYFLGFEEDEGHFDSFGGFEENSEGEQIFRAAAGVRFLLYQGISEGFPAEGTIVSIEALPEECQRLLDTVTIRGDDIIHPIIPHNPERIFAEYEIIGELKADVSGECFIPITVRIVEGEGEASQGEPVYPPYVENLMFKVVVLPVPDAPVLTVADSAFPLVVSDIDLAAGEANGVIGAGRITVNDPDQDIDGQALSRESFLSLSIGPVNPLENIDNAAVGFADGDGYESDEASGELRLNGESIASIDAEDSQITFTFDQSTINSTATLNAIIAHLQVRYINGDFGQETSQTLTFYDGTYTASAQFNAIGNNPFVIEPADTQLQTAYVENSTDSVSVVPNGIDIRTIGVDVVGTASVRISVSNATQTRYRANDGGVGDDRIPSFLQAGSGFNVGDSGFTQSDTVCDRSDDDCTIAFVAAGGAATTEQTTALLRAIRFSAPGDEDPRSFITVRVVIVGLAANISGTNTTESTATYTVTYTLPIMQQEDPTQVRFFNAAGEPHNDDIDPNPLEVFEGGSSVRFTVELDAVELGEDISARTPLEEDNSFRLDLNREIVTNPNPDPYSTMTESFFFLPFEYGRGGLGRISQERFLSDDGVVRRVEFAFRPALHKYGRVEIIGFETQANNLIELASSSGRFDIVVNPTNDPPFFDIFIFPRTVQGIDFGGVSERGSSPTAAPSSDNIRFFRDPSSLPADNPELYFLGFEEDEGDFDSFGVPLQAPAGLAFFLSQGDFEGLPAEDAVTVGALPEECERLFDRLEIIRRDDLFSSLDPSAMDTLSPRVPRFAEYKLIGRLKADASGECFIPITVRIVEGEGQGEPTYPSYVENLMVKAVVLPVPDAPVTPNAPVLTVADSAFPLVVSDIDLAADEASSVIGAGKITVNDPDQDIDGQALSRESFLSLSIGPVNPSENIANAAVGFADGDGYESDEVSGERELRLRLNGESIASIVAENSRITFMFDQSIINSTATLNAIIERLQVRYINGDFVQETSQTLTFYDGMYTVSAQFNAIGNNLLIIEPATAVLPTEYEENSVLGVLIVPSNLEVRNIDTDNDGIKHDVASVRVSVPNAMQMRYRTGFNGTPNFLTAGSTAEGFSEPVGVCDADECSLEFHAPDGMSASPEQAEALLRGITFSMPANEDPREFTIITIVITSSPTATLNVPIPQVIVMATYTLPIMQQEDPTQVRFFNAAGEELHNDDIDPNPLEVFEGGSSVRFTVESDAVELGEDMSARTPLGDDNSFRLDLNREIATNPIPNPYSTMTELFFLSDSFPYGSGRLGRILQERFLSDNGVLRRVEFGFTPRANTYGRVEIRRFETQANNLVELASPGGGFDIVVNPTNDRPSFGLYILERTIGETIFGGLSQTDISDRIRFFRDPGLLSSADRIYFLGFEENEGHFDSFGRFEETPEGEPLFRAPAGLVFIVGQGVEEGVPAEDDAVTVGALPEECERLFDRLEIIRGDGLFSILDPSAMDTFSLIAPRFAEYKLIGELKADASGECFIPITVRIVEGEGEASQGEPVYPPYVENLMFKAIVLPVPNAPVLTVADSAFPLVVSDIDLAAGEASGVIGAGRITVNDPDQDVDEQALSRESFLSLSIGPVNPLENIDNAAVGFADGDGYESDEASGELRLNDESIASIVAEDSRITFMFDQSTINSTATLNAIIERLQVRYINGDFGQETSQTLTFYDGMYTVSAQFNAIGNNLLIIEPATAVLLTEYEENSVLGVPIVPSNLEVRNIDTDNDGIKHDVASVRVSVPNAMQMRYQAGFNGTPNFLTAGSTAEGFSEPAGVCDADECSLEFHAPDGMPASPEQAEALLRGITFSMPANEDPREFTTITIVITSSPTATLNVPIPQVIVMATYTLPIIVQLNTPIVMVNELSIDSVVVSWNAIENASSYTVTVATDGDSTTVETVLTSETLIDLQVDTAYTVSVVAMAVGFLDSEAGEVTFGILPDGSVVFLPDQPSFGVIPGIKRLRVTWLPPANDGGLPILGYRVIWRVTAGGGEMSNNISDPAIMEYEIDSLTNGVTYTVTVVSVNELGESPILRTVNATPNALRLRVRVFLQGALQ